MKGNLKANQKLHSVGLDIDVYLKMRKHCREKGFIIKEWLNRAVIEVINQQKETECKN